MKESLESTISRDAICRLWPAYEALVRYRLLTGCTTYGDQSFKRPPSELLSEIAEELMDVTGWAFILWCRIQTIQQELMEKESEQRPT